MSDVVYLHVGAPKTGTTYVQDRLSLNRAALKSQGYVYPTGLRGDMFMPALELIERPWGGMRPDARGEWDGLVRRARRARGTVIISHEILAAATPEQVQRAMRDLAFAEVHLVYSARDIARQVPAEWQEALKHRRKPTFKSFLKQVQKGGSIKSSPWFWAVQGLPDVLTRWGDQLPPDRVHLITVPQPGGPEGELWRRFCMAVGLDPTGLSHDSDRRNPSLGIAESTLVRRLNGRLRKAGVASVDYRALVRHVVAHETLAHRSGMRAVRLPPHAFDWADEIAQHWIDWVTRAGIDVVGDLEDLRPVRPGPDDVWQDPDKPRAREVNAAALDALVALTIEAARRTDPDEQVPVKVARVMRRVRKR
jgi:hypothetical protein